MCSCHYLNLLTVSDFSNTSCMMFSASLPEHLWVRQNLNTLSLSQQHSCKTLFCTLHSFDFLVVPLKELIMVTFAFDSHSETGNYTVIL